VSNPARKSNASQTVSQHRRWLKTRFKFTRKYLDYGLEMKGEASFRQKIAWDRLAAPSSYITTVEADRDFRWLAFVLTPLALVATLRGGPQPLLFLMYAGLTAAALFGLWLTRGWRSVGHTAIPTQKGNILVLTGPQHDGILEEVAGHRTAALSRLAEPEPGLTRRVYLRRLRWLVENEAMRLQEAQQRQQLVLPDRIIPIMPPSPKACPPQHFRQRRPGAAIEIDLHADRIDYRRATLLGNRERYSVFLRDLQEPSSYEGTDHQIELTLFVFAWLVTALFAIGTMIGAHQPANRYVGGAGLSHAITDFGPLLLAAVLFAAAVPLLTRLRFAEPWPGIKLLRDWRFDAIRAAIEARRIAALRALAEPDPLLTCDEQRQQLFELYENGVISQTEYERAGSRAAFAGDDPALDAPMLPEPEPETPVDRALH